MVLLCILLSSCSSQDCSGINGVAGAVGRWLLLGSVVGNGAALSGGAVNSSVVGNGQSHSKFLRVKCRVFVIGSGCGCSCSLKE